LAYDLLPLDAENPVQSSSNSLIVKALREATYGPRRLDPLLYKQYVTREYWGPIGMEEMFPQGEGRPSVDVLLRPLRMIVGEEVAGIDGVVTENVRVGELLLNEEIQVSPRPDLEEDGLLLILLARR